MPPALLTFHSIQLQQLRRLSHFLVVYFCSPPKFKLLATSFDPKSSVDSLPVQINAYFSLPVLVRFF
jgi:hypothetical protein